MALIYFNLYRFNAIDIIIYLGVSMTENNKEKDRRVALYRDKAFIKDSEIYALPTIIEKIDHRQFVLKNEQICSIHHAYNSKRESCFYHHGSIIKSINDRRDMLNIALDSLIKSSGGVDACIEASTRSWNEDALIVFDFPETAFDLESFIIQTKSLLDSLTQLISIVFEFGLRVFKDSGRFLMQSLESKSVDNNNALKLRKLYNIHKSYWIDQLISYRNEATHHGKIGGVFNYNISLKDAHRCDPSYIQPPQMPDLETIESYVNRILKRLDSLSFWTVQICFREMERMIESNEKQLSDFKQGNLKCWCSSGINHSSCHGR
jgi:hypothetical protein